MEHERKQIVILGAGFGGLRAAIQLSKRIQLLDLAEKYEVLLVDRNSYHTYTPLLYEVATTSLATASAIDLKSVVTHDITSIVKHCPITFRCGEITTLDPISGTVVIDDFERITAEYLVLALGAEVNYQAIEGLTTYALPLKTFYDAVKIRAALMSTIRKHTGKSITIVIGGAGSTGVETAGELREMGINPTGETIECDVRVVLVQGGPEILPGFDEKIRQKVQKRFRTLGVEVMLDKRITRLERHDVFFDDDTSLPYDLFIWTGGVRGAAIIDTLPLKSEVRKRAEVESVMKCLPEKPNLELRPKVYGLGDVICFYHPKTGKPIHGVARAAISQANVVVDNIMEEIKLHEGLSPRATLRAYKPIEYPYILPVGGKYAVTKIGPFIISGFFGWLLKGLVELTYLLSIMHPMRAFKIWFKGLKIFIQNDRLG